MDTGVQPVDQETAKRPVTNQSGGEATNKQTKQAVVQQIEELHERIPRKHVIRHALIVSMKVQMWMNRETTGTGNPMKKIERGEEAGREEISRQDKRYCN